MSCWIPGPYEEAWAPGLRRRRQEALQATHKLETKGKVAAAKRSAKRKRAAAPAAPEECPMPIPNPCPLPTPKTA